LLQTAASSSLGGAESEIENRQGFVADDFSAAFTPSSTSMRSAQVRKSTRKKLVTLVRRQDKLGHLTQGKNHSTCRFLAVWFDYVDEMVRKAVAVGGNNF
jgi:hypothetical protein